MLIKSYSLIQIRNKTTITSFKQWKDTLIFKRFDGKHVWNLPKFIPHEYGFRRIARKPPFFKFRKFVFPKIHNKFPHQLINRTRYSLVNSSDPITKYISNGSDVIIRYGWESRSSEYHRLRDEIKRKYKFVNVIGIPSDSDELQILNEYEDVLINITNINDVI
ncbi:hypothetical protein TpMuguga_03g00812 [Theileria parva strain Muguga]|uniref:uncharacterized protein n=1 Tax=Theileria parva strain Muguga TaxID=333668 RepID=UPI001C621218|nr:uncharacterized protein TpMuguga_03g00812 [Theileria parva strain Muguga]EAN30653.2 hypothetical protein TpMuguga_03g00812 [Theileria parva strain Muguga]